MQIIDIPVDLIRDHPLHEDLYGEPTVTPAFVDSIRTQGILQPLTLVDTSSDTEVNDFLLISGRRRLTAARKIGLTTVPCEIKEYESDEDERADLIALNMYREKNDAILAREVEELMAIEVTRAKQRQRNGFFDDSSGVSPKETHGDEEELRGRADAIVADRLGISRPRVVRLLTVFGEEYRINQFDKLRKNPKVKTPGEFFTALKSRWETIRQDRLNDQISLTKAAAQIADLLKAATDQAAGSDVKGKLKRQTYPVRVSFEIVKPEDKDAYSVIAEAPYGEETLQVAQRDGGMHLIIGGFAAPVDLSAIPTVKPLKVADTVS